MTFALTLLPSGVEATLLIVLLLSSALWLGGLFTLVLVTRASAAALEPAARVELFRRFGKQYGIIQTVNLGVGLIVGGVLLTNTAVWSAMNSVLTGLAAALVVFLLIGIAQARAMTRLRRELAASGGDEELAARVRAGGRLAVLLRTLITLLSLALPILFMLLPAVY